MMKYRSMRALFGFFLGLLTLAAAADETAYRAMFLGDVHYDAEEYHPGEQAKASSRRTVKMWKKASPQLLKAAGEEAAKENVAFVVQLGDIVQGGADTPELQEKMLRTAFSILKRDFPDRQLLVVKGNHDVFTKTARNDNGPAERGLLPPVAAELKVPKLADGHYTFCRGRDLYIAVDGFVGEKNTVEFVKKVLADHPDTRYVFLLTHLPLLPSSAKGPVWLLPGYEEIAAMLETRKALVIAAHTHKPSLTTRTTQRGTLPQLVVSSMGTYWHPDKLVPDPLSDWEKFVAAAQKVKLVGRNTRVPKELPRIMALGSYTHRRDFSNSGFAILDVNDSGVTARVFTNLSGTPSTTLKLIDGPAAK